ncbi:hypothetical protein CAAN1_06S00914 [[Candida] anglica]|uniref:Uncharacterized protein n=1 Tax=[Candida] anglica TaxID=148631 RepID=A0ABP0ELL4_9ASCO
MTHLVLDPSKLKNAFPRASQSRVERIRTFAQVVRYDINRAVLWVTTVPTIRDNNGSAPPMLEWSMSKVMGSLKSDVVDSGAVVDVVGYYNGKTVDIVECVAIDGGSLSMAANLDILHQITKLQDI